MTDQSNVTDMPLRDSWRKQPDIPSGVFLQLFENLLSRRNKSELTVKKYQYQASLVFISTNTMAKVRSNTILFSVIFSVFQLAVPCQLPDAGDINWSKVIIGFEVTLFFFRFKLEIILIADRENWAMV